MTKKLILFLTLGTFAFLSSCSSDDNKNSTPPVVGTWKLISSEVKLANGSYELEELEPCYQEYGKVQFFADKSAIITVAEENENDPSICDVFESEDASWTLDGDKLTVKLKDPDNGNTLTLVQTVTFANSNNRMITTYKEDGEDFRDTYEKVK